MGFAAFGIFRCLTLDPSTSLVGCDGVRSAVRRLTGIGFPGRSVMRSVMLADVRPKELPAEAVTTNANRYGVASLLPFGDGRYRAIGWIAGDGPDPAGPRAELERWPGLPRWARSVRHGTFFRRQA